MDKNDQPKKFTKYDCLICFFFWKLKFFILTCHKRSLKEPGTIAENWETFFLYVFSIREWEARQNPQDFGTQLDRIYIDYRSHFPWSLLFKWCLWKSSMVMPRLWVLWAKGPCGVLFVSSGTEYILATQLYGDVLEHNSVLFPRSSFT